MDCDISEINNITNNKKRTFVKNKKKLYVAQRNEILKNIFNIIGINNNNKTFYSNIIEESNEIDHQITNLEQNILTFFNVSSWPAFKKNSKITDKKSLSIIKSVLKDMDIEYVSSCIRIKDQNLNTKYATMYVVITNI
jgi:hypothetical protein